MVTLQAMLRPMRVIAVRRLFRRLPPGFSVAEFASCMRRAASAGSALTICTASSMPTSSLVSALRTRMATSGKLGRSIFSPASSAASESTNARASPARAPDDR